MKDFDLLYKEGNAGSKGLVGCSSPHRHCTVILKPVLFVMIFIVAFYDTYDAVINFVYNITTHHIISYLIFLLKTSSFVELSHEDLSNSQFNVNYMHTLCIKLSKYQHDQPSNTIKQTNFCGENWSMELEINSSPPSATYMRQLIRSVLVQIMAGRLFGANPLSKPMMGYCQLDTYEQLSAKF